MTELGELYRRLKDYSKTDYYPYHMPGHKRLLCGEFPREIMDIDITEIDGFDNLHAPEEILRRLQDEAAGLYGADESFYLINGSTCGVLAAISAAVPRGGRILMTRGAHKSAYHAAYLRNLTVSYLYPEMMEEYDIYDAVTPEQIAEAFSREPVPDAVFLVSPTYEGRIADIETIAKLVHSKGIPLIVDEAHGAHLGLAEGFAKNSCQCGADLVIHSVHKTLPALTQSALLHVNGRLVDRERLRRFLHIYQSSSPSYVLMAGIDNALQLVKEQGDYLFARLQVNYLRMLTELSECRNLHFLPLDARQDIGKLVILSSKAGLSGQQIYDILLEEYHLQLEMAAADHCLAMFTIGDSDEAYTRMTDALLAIDRDISAGKWQTQPQTEGGDSRETSLYHMQPEVSLSLADAWDAEKEEIPLAQAAGRIAGDFVNLTTAGVNLVLNLLLVKPMGLYGVILSTVVATVIVGMPWLIHNLFTTLFDGEDRQSYLGTLVFYGSVTFLNCMLTDRVCSQIPVEGIRELLERALVCLLVSNGIFLLCYGGRKDFRALLAMGKRFLPEIPHDKATSGNDRSAEETTKFADYGKAGAFYEDCSSGNRVCGIVHGSSAGPES